MVVADRTIPSATRRARAAEASTGQAKLAAECTASVAALVASITTFTSTCAMGLRQEAGQQKHAP